MVILRQDPETGRLLARVANLAGITAEGTSERDVLIAVTKKFRTAIQESLQSQQTVAWLDPPESPGSGEQQRFIPIHL
jgi:hypothetical protein